MKNLLLILVFFVCIESYASIKLTISATVIDSESFIPDSVFDNIHIDSLTIRYCDIKKLPRQVNKFKKLKYLNLSGCNMLSSLSIDSLTDLEYLNLSHTHITVLPLGVCELKKLKFLDLSKTQITKIPDEIGALTNLELLRLNNTHLAVLPASVGGFVNLKELWLINTKVDFIPLELTKIKSLQYLWVYWSDIKNGKEVIAGFRATNPNIFFGHSTYK